MKSLRQFSFCAIVLMMVVAIFSCAKIGAPSGGMLDTKAPGYVKSFPQRNATNFKGKKIVVYFNEIIKLNNVQQNLIISPPLETKPNVVAAGKKLIVKFGKSKLIDNTTYTIYFGNSIIDNNAGNPYPNFSFTFSTGNEIDSLKISGKVIDAQLQSALNDVYVMLYDNQNDSAPRKTQPLYFTKTAKDGSFTISNIKKKPYRIYVLKDADNDLRYSQPKELFAYGDSLIVPSMELKFRIDTIRCKHDDTLKIKNKNIPAKPQKPCKDSIVNKTDTLYFPNNIVLKCFTETQKKQFLVNSSREKREKVMFVFNTPLIDDSLEIEHLSQDKPYGNTIREFNKTGDTLTYWLVDKSLRENDSLQFVLHYLKPDSSEAVKWLTDTVKNKYDKRKDKRSNEGFCKLAFSVGNETELNLNNQLTIESETPMKSVNYSKFKLWLATDTLSIKNTTGGFYAFDSARGETVNELMMPRIKPYISKAIVEEQKIKEYKSGKNKFLIGFAKPLLPTDSVWLIDEQGRDNNEWSLWEKDKTSNSFFCWITDVRLQTKKTFTFKVLFNGKILDTLEYAKPRMTIPASGANELVIPELQMQSLCLDELIPLNMINPIDSVDKEGISIYKSGDTSKSRLPVEVTRLGAYPRTVFIGCRELKKAMKYVLAVKAGSIRDIKGNICGDQELEIATQKPRRNYSLIPVANPSCRQDSVNVRKNIIVSPWIAGKKYQLMIEPGAFTDAFGRMNDTTTVIFSIPSKESVGKLDISIKGIVVEKGSVFVQLTSKDGKTVIDSRTMKADGTLNFSNLAAGEYGLSAVYDLNDNKKWDSGSFIDKRQPETIVFKSSGITVKAGWENKAEWNIGEKPEVKPQPKPEEIKPFKK